MGAAVSSLPPLSATVIAQVTAEYQRVQLQHPSSGSQRRAHRSSSSARLSFSAARRSSATSIAAAASPFLSTHSTTSPLAPPLTLEQLLHFHLPPHLPLSLSHLSTLYCLSLQCDGPISLAALLDFVQWCDAKAAEWLRAERQSKLEALFALKMAYDAQRLGEQWLVQWLCGLIAGEQRHSVPHAGRVGSEASEFVHRDAVMAGHSLLRPYLPSDMSFQELFDSLQHVAEQHVSRHSDFHTIGLSSADTHARTVLETDCHDVSVAVCVMSAQSLLELDDASLDDYIPISVVSHSAQH